MKAPGIEIAVKIASTKKAKSSVLLLTPTIEKKRMKYIIGNNPNINNPIFIESLAI